MPSDEDGFSCPVPGAIVWRTCYAAGRNAPAEKAREAGQGCPNAGPEETPGRIVT